MKQRNIDGIYFRVKRDEKWQNICFSDLFEDEMDEILTGKSNLWLCNMCKRLAEVIRRLGNEFEIIGVDGEEDEQ